MILTNCATKAKFSSINRCFVAQDMTEKKGHFSQAFFDSVKNSNYCCQRSQSAKKVSLRRKKKNKTRVLQNFKEKKIRLLKNEPSCNKLGFNTLLSIPCHAQLVITLRNRFSGCHLDINIYFFRDLSKISTVLVLNNFGKYPISLHNIP